MFPMTNVDNIELTIYLKDGNSINLDISELQLSLMLKIIGFKLEKNKNSYTCFSDDTLLKLIKMKGNPLRLNEVSNE